MFVKGALGEVPRLLHGASIFRRHRSNTMIAIGPYIANLAIVASALKNPQLVAGAVVECGTWKGGMSAGLIEIGGPNRDYYFFDSFEGLPVAKEIDGRAAIEWQSRRDSDTYYNNCSASLDEFLDAIAATHVPRNRLHVYKGFFCDTLPSAPLPSIAILRLDGDWYESTMECLRKFWDSVLPGGVIIIDDYFAWDGCSRAVHDFLTSRSATERIETYPYGGVAFIRKRTPQPLKYQPNTS
jgi:O-methyltransferase